jgi:hypothetical protein
VIAVPVLLATATPAPRRWQSSTIEMSRSLGKWRLNIAMSSTAIPQICRSGLGRSDSGYDRRLSESVVRVYFDRVWFCKLLMMAWTTHRSTGTHIDLTPFLPRC